MVPVPIARRLVRMPVRPRTTSSWARYLPETAGIARPAARALLATQVAARPEAERRRKSLRCIEDSYARQDTPARAALGVNACELTRLLRTGERGVLKDHEAAVGVALDSRRVGAEKLTPPPVPGRALLRHRGEPILPENGTKIPRRGVGERISGEELEDVVVVGEEELLGARDDGVLRPRAERGKPEIPVEARLIGRIEAGGAGKILRLVTEGIGRPGGAVVGALELDLVAVRSHHGEEAVLIGDAEGLEGDDGLTGQRLCAPEHM